MHPKQVPGIITASMLLTLTIMATISAAFLDWYLVVVGGTFVIALIGIMLGRHVPKPYDSSINDVVTGMRTLVSKFDALCDSVDSSPLVLQRMREENAEDMRRIKRALTMLLTRSGRDSRSERSEESR